MTRIYVSFGMLPQAGVWKSTSEGQEQTGRSVRGMRPQSKQGTDNGGSYRIAMGEKRKTWMGAKEGWEPRCIF